MKQTRTVWWVLPVLIVSLIPAMLFWSPMAPLLIILSLGFAIGAGYLAGGRRFWSAVGAGAMSQLVVLYTYLVDQPGYEVYPWLLERGSRTNANTIAWAVWVMVCLSMAGVGYAWGSGRRTLVLRLAGWFLVVIGIVAGAFMFVMIAAGAAYAGVDPGAWVLVALIPAVPIVRGVALLWVGRRTKTREGLSTQRLH